MLLLHVPSDGSRATLISFPRDSWVSIPGFGQDKLNAAYSYGSNGGADPDAGRRLLIEVIQNLTGLTVDHYVEIGLLGFYNITNALGGVTINLCEPQQDSYSGINLPAGVQKIQGSQALAFVRQRHGLDDYGGDLQRARRQQYFLSQVFKQVQSAGTLLNPIKIQNLLSAVSGSLAMDDPSFALPLAQQMANLSAGNTTMANIPITGFGVSSDGQDIVNVDYTAMPDFIAQVIGATDPKYAPAAQTAPANVTVDVLNGTGIDGLARANANALSAAGFAIGSVQDGPVTSSTIIRYPDGKQSQAKALAAEVPGALLSKNNTVGRVTLILGQNEVQVASLTPAAPTDSAPTDSPTANTTRSGADTSCIN
jgi:LCP family protein required for cell wall assembly